jgi:CRP/FNR family transcriptional regulator, nitrogen oxide reductase regulator
MNDRRRSPVELQDIDAEACTWNLRHRLLQETPLFSNVNQEGIATINSRFKDTGYTAGETIIREGDAAERFFIVAMGVVTLFRATDTGETILLDVLTSGESFGSIAGFGPSSYTDSAAARTTVCVLSIDGGGFRSIIAEHSSVALRTIETLSQRLHQAEEMTTQLGSAPAEARIAHILLRLAVKLGRPWNGGNLIDAPLTREDLASMAGTTTETCSRTVSTFRREGAIASGRSWIAVMDPEALRERSPTI